MADYIVGEGNVGAHELQLAPGVVQVVRFSSNLPAVEVTSDGAAPVYFTVDDDGDPTVAGDECFAIPATPAVRAVCSPGFEATVVKLISAGSPVVSVARTGD